MSELILDATVQEPPPGPFPGLALALPPGLLTPEQAAGRYVLARCGAQSPEERAEEWSIYLRRPLFVAGQGRLHSPAEPPGEAWHFLLPASVTAAPGDPGYAWLARRRPGETMNLLGPFGNGFRLHPHSRNLLLLADRREESRADLDWLALLMPAVHPTLDRGGRVTLLLRQRESPAPELVRSLPLAVEIQTASSDSEWRALLEPGLAWADQVLAGLPQAGYAELAQAVRQARFRLEEGFVQVLVQADLVCATGACLACVVPLPGGGLTRACIHGPVFDLTRLAA